MKLALASLLTIGALLIPLPAARACGGGVVTTQTGSLGANAQRILISVHDGITDVITQIGVPATTADYAVLVPVPSEPTFDPTPVSSADIDSFDMDTAPALQRSNNEGGFPIPDCGCPSGGGTKGLTGPQSDAGTRVSQPVTIGPVTAVTLTADNGDAINTWLADNGFVIPAGDQSIVDGYAGPGRFFIAIRRSDTAATGGDAVTAFVEARAAGTPFDVVLMDLHMPGMDGIEAARRIRAAETDGRRTPIIALTADAFPESRDACRAAGMDGFVTKPLDRQRLETALARFASARAA
jgi:CheY-like chemotaxis protein